MPGLPDRRHSRSVRFLRLTPFPTLELTKAAAYTPPLLTDLPLELLHLVAKSLDTRSLKSWNLASRGLYAVGTEVLHSRLVLDWKTIFEGGRSYEVLKQIGEHARVGEGVRTLRFVGAETELGFQRISSAENHLLIAAALLNMPKLQTVLWQGTNVDITTLFDIFRERCPRLRDIIFDLKGRDPEKLVGMNRLSNLRTFKLSGCDDSSSAQFNESVLEVINASPGLQHLSILHSYSVAIDVIADLVDHSFEELQTLTLHNVLFSVHALAKLLARPHNIRNLRFSTLHESPEAEAMTEWLAHTNERSSFSSLESLSYCVQFADEASALRQYAAIMSLSQTLALRQLSLQAFSQHAQPTWEDIAWRITPFSPLRNSLRRLHVGLKTVNSSVIDSIRAIFPHLTHLSTDADCHVDQRQKFVLSLSKFKSLRWLNIRTTCMTLCWWSSEHCLDRATAARPWLEGMGERCVGLDGVCTLGRSWVFVRGGAVRGGVAVVEGGDEVQDEFAWI